MNNTFGIWLIGAGVAVLALLLLLGAPAVEQEATPELQAAPEVGAAEASDVASSYWQPVVVEASAPRTVTASTSYVAPCPSCGSTVVRAVAAAPALVGGCGYPSTPCGDMACAPVARSCYDVCADPCRVMRPGINRNMPLCVDECSFVQLHSTVSHPICGQFSFEWSASKGWFLDPRASDPLYFVPATQFCNGEDVWIMLLVTDVAGAQYSDVVSLHVRDLP